MEWPKYLGEKMNRYQSGFNLVELLAVVLIVGLISAIALPSYNKYVVSTRRAEAQSALLGLANAIERHKLRTGSYRGIANPDTLGTPTIFATQAPIEGAAKMYDLRVTFDASSYTVFAIPIIGALQEGNGPLSLTHTGERAWDSANDGSYSSSW